MSNLDNKQVRAEIAASGFAETVERHGFQKVSPTHWRRVSDEVTWRVAMVNAGYERSPGCFEVQMGGLVHGLDDIGRKVEGEPLSSRITGLSALAHVHYDLGGNVSDMYYSGDADPFDDTLPEPIRHSEFMRRKYKGCTTRDSFQLQDMCDQGLIVKHYGRAGTASSSCAFMVHDRDIRDVAEVAGCYFETYFADQIDRQSCFLPIYQHHWGPKAENRRPHEIRLHLCAAWMASDLSHVDALAEEIFAEARITEEEHIAIYLKKPRPSHHRVMPEDILRNVFVKNRKSGWLRQAQEVVEVCDAIGSRYPDHGLNFAEIDQLRQEVKLFGDKNPKLMHAFHRRQL